MSTADEPCTIGKLYTVTVTGTSATLATIPVPEYTTIIMFIRCTATEEDFVATTDYKIFMYEYSIRRASGSPVVALMDSSTYGSSSNANLTASVSGNNIVFTVTAGVTYNMYYTMSVIDSYLTCDS